MTDKSQKSPARLTLAQVARGIGTSAQNLSKTYVKRGVLSVKRDAMGKPYVELVEVLRVFGDRFKLAIDAAGVDTVNQQQYRQVGSVATGLFDLQTRLEHALCDLQEAKKREQEAKERELWLRAQVDRLSDNIKLLEGPKAAKRGLLHQLFR